MNHLSHRGEMHNKREADKSVFKPENGSIVRDFRCCFCSPKKDLDKR